MNITPDRLAVILVDNVEKEMKRCRSILEKGGIDINTVQTKTPFNSFVSPTGILVSVEFTINQGQCKIDSELRGCEVLSYNPSNVSYFSDGTYYGRTLGSFEAEYIDYNPVLHPGVMMCYAKGFVDVTARGTTNENITFPEDGSYVSYMRFFPVGWLNRNSK